MRRFFSALYLLPTLSLVPWSGQSALTPPQLGWVRDAGNGLRPVTGLAANFILGPPASEGVVSSAFSGSFGIVKTEASLLVFDQDGQALYSAATDPGPALFAFSDDGAPAFIYVSQSQTLLKWNTDHLESAPFSLATLGGAVQSIASPSPGRAAVVVKRDDGLWLVDLDFGTQTLLPGIEGPVLLRNNGALLYAGPHGLVLRQADQTEQAIPGALAAATFEPMGKDWVHITELDSARHFAVRLEAGREQLYQLPETHP